MKLSLFEFIFRGIPEGFLFIYATYVFSKKTVRLRSFMLSSILFSIAIFSIRLLPIHTGINNILNIIVFILLSTKVNDIDLIKSIKVVFATMLLGFICEGINILLIKFVLRVDLNYAFSNPKLKLLYGIPSLLILGIIVLIVSYYNNVKLKKKKLETITNN